MRPLGLSEPGVFIILLNGVLPSGEGALAEPKNSNLRKEGRASTSNKNFLQMWNLQESRKEPIFSRVSANRDHPPPRLL